MEDFILNFDIKLKTAIDKAFDLTKKYKLNKKVSKTYKQEPIDIIPEEIDGISLKVPRSNLVVYNDTTLPISIEIKDLHGKILKHSY